MLRVPPGVRLADLRARSGSVLLLFCRSRADLERRRDQALRRLPADGRLWVAWPKRASGVVTDLTGGVVRDDLLRHGVVDVKVAALDDTWTGLCFVVRVAERAGWGSGGR